MRVSLITRHAITNYGSLLQTLATQIVIERLGHTCEVVNYIRADENYRQHERTLLKRKPEWNRNPIKRGIYLALRQPESRLSGRRFAKERNRLLHLSQLYSSMEELTQKPPAADLYLTGSDQVWGPVENGDYDSAYCLSFVPDAARKASFAASFGRDTLTEEQMQFFRRWLGQFQRITVREDSAVSLIEEMGFEAERVLDPTLLLDAEDWARFMTPLRRKPYVLVYQIHQNPALGLYAKKVADAMHLPLVRISTSLHQMTQKGKLVWCPPIGAFLSYIKNAACLITDSFHGTAFAINFETPFVEVLPQNHTETRNKDVLAWTGLTDRIVTDVNNTSIAVKRPNFECARRTLSEQRIRTIEIFKSILEQE